MFFFYFKLIDLYYYLTIGLAAFDVLEKIGISNYFFISKGNLQPIDAVLVVKVIGDAKFALPFLNFKIPNVANYI